MVTLPNCLFGETSSILVQTAMTTTEYIRKEIHSRQSFAYDRGIFWFEKIQHSVKSGNVFSCKATKKYLQARRIYIHYQNEFQRKQLLPLSN